MRTRLQILASRANGARSRGPASPEGKRRSALNATRHALTAETVLLSTESGARFESLLQSLVDTYQPADEGEFLCLEEMAWAKWRLRRAVGYETTLLEDNLPPAEDTVSKNSRSARTWEQLQRNSPGFRNLTRYETAQCRAYFRALEELLMLQECKLRNEPNTPHEEEENPPV